jgi:hypothetical protein
MAAAAAAAGVSFPPTGVQRSLLPSPAARPAPAPAAAAAAALQEQENILKILEDIQNNPPVELGQEQQNAKDKFLNKLMRSLPAIKKGIVARLIAAAQAPIERTVGVFYDDILLESVHGVGDTDFDAAAVKYGVGPDDKLAFGTTIDSVVKLGLGSCISVPGHYGQLVYEVQWGSEAARVIGDSVMCLGSLYVARDMIIYCIESGIMVCSFGFANLGALQKLFVTAYNICSEENIINALKGINMTEQDAILMWNNIKSFSSGQIRYLLITLYLVAVRKWRSINGGDPQAAAAAAQGPNPPPAAAQQSFIISLINDVWLLFFNNVFDPTMEAVNSIFTLNFTVRPEGQGGFDFLVASTGALFQRGYDALILRSRLLSPAANRNSVLLKVASLSLKIPICDEASPEEKRTLVWKLVNDVKEHLFAQMCEVARPPQAIQTLRSLLVASLDQKPDARMRRDSLLTYDEAQEFFMCFPLFRSNVVTPTLVRVYNEEMASGDIGEGSLDPHPPSEDSMAKNLAGLKETPRCVVDPNFFVLVSQTNAQCSDTLLARTAVAVGFDEPGVAVQPAMVDGKYQEFFTKIILDRIIKVKGELTKWNIEHPDEPQVDIAAVDKSLKRIVHIFITRFFELISRSQSAPPKNLKETIKQAWDNLSTKMLGFVQGVTANSAQFVKSIVAEGMSMGFIGCLHEFMSGAVATTANVKELSLLVESSCREIADAAPALAAPALAAPSDNHRRVKLRMDSPPPPSSLTFRVFKPSDSAPADTMGSGKGGSKSRKNTKRTRRHSKGRKSSKAAKKTQQRRSSRHRRSSRKGRK